ncbi:MAG TPA: hydrogen peroxide-inducible genes activator [Azospirillaceae bacterium]|nr:hydrogen peroxide-inducible genes activator [Azospirillaceae bacterium]
MKPLPSLRQLRYLVAVIEHRHFGRAAETCFVTQSTLSAGLQEMEHLLGARLVERTKRSVSPTPLGQELAQRAQQVLRQVEDMADLATAAREPMTGPLRLGVIPTIGPFLLPRVLPDLRETFPHLALYLREDQTARLIDQLHAGTLDVAVLALPYEARGIDTLWVAEDRFWAALPPTHRLATDPKVNAADLSLDDLLLLEDGHCLRDHALAACALEGARKNEGFQGTSLYTLVQMVAGGLGITLLPQIALDADILRGTDVVARPLVGDRPSRWIGLAWRRAAGRRTTFEKLGAFLKERLVAPPSMRPERLVEIVQER